MPGGVAGVPPIMEAPYADFRDQEKYDKLMLVDRFPRPCAGLLPI